MDVAKGRLGKGSPRLRDTAEKLKPRLSLNTPGAGCFQDTERLTEND